eukprot:6868783-Pyramimonas_sp.AAC.1
MGGDGREGEKAEHWEEEDEEVKEHRYGDYDQDQGRAPPCCALSQGSRKRRRDGKRRGRRGRRMRGRRRRSLKIEEGGRDEKHRAAEVQGRGHAARPGSPRWPP